MIAILARKNFQKKIQPQLQVSDFLVVILSPFFERIFSIKNILSVNSLTSAKRKEKESPKQGKIKIRIIEKSTQLSTI
jgi:hypothetical protein